MALWPECAAGHALGRIGSAAGWSRAAWRAAAMGGWLVLGLTGLALLGASWVWPRCQPSPKWLRRLGLVAFVAVVLQGVLGGLRVVLFKDAIGIFHATLAQLFFVLICAIALFTSRWWQTQPARIPSTTNINSQLSSSRHLLILAQLVLGAAMRHQHAGLAIPDFPLAYGKLWPAMDAASVAHYNQQRIEIVASTRSPPFRSDCKWSTGWWRSRFLARSPRRLVRPARARRQESLEPAGPGLARVDSDASAPGRGHDMVEQGRGHRHRARARRRAGLGAGRNPEHDRPIGE